MSDASPTQEFAPILQFADHRAGGPSGEPRRSPFDEAERILEASGRHRPQSHTQAA